MCRLSPRGESGLKSCLFGQTMQGSYCLSPRGESGLKYISLSTHRQSILSLPAWGEWIEINFHCYNLHCYNRLSPRGESGLKSVCNATAVCLIPSLPAWGEWIEISLSSSAIISRFVSPRVGRVD